MSNLIHNQQENIENPNEKKWKFGFWGLSFVFLILFVIFGLQDGTSGDEFYHLKHAEHVLNFYKTFGDDTVAVTVSEASSAENSREYGQIPDNIAAAVAAVFGIEDIITVRHLVNIIFGWVGMIFAALLAYRISRKWYAAIITAILLFLSPRYLGHAFNNLKDIPFAATMMMGTYYIYYFLETFPRPPKKVLIMLALSIGLAIATRVGGLLLIAYFAFYVFIYFVNQWICIYKENKTNIKPSAKSKIKKKNTNNEEVWKLFKRLFVYGVGISLAGYF
jgi:hypothetical protein